MDPFRTKLRDSKKRRAIGVVREQMERLPRTTCEGRIQCCNTGCPNMTYSEYLSMREAFIDGMGKQGRLDLIIKCVRRYITKQDPLLPRPCVLLTEHGTCSVYESRPFRCRTYGLISSKMYERMARAAANDAGVPVGKMPLCHQCPKVKVKPEDADSFPDGRIPDDLMEEMEAILQDNDLNLGIPLVVQKQGMAYLTIHDWHLMTELGEAWMGNLSAIRLSDSTMAKEQFVAALKDAVAGLIGGD
jgi:Fe-S-cluster containining protein